MSTSPEETPLICDVRRLDTAIVVTLAGDVDLHRSPDLLRRLEEFANEKPAKLILDLRHVAYMDSSGVGTLVKLYRQVTGYQGQFILVCLQQWVCNLLEITKLDKFFSIYATEEEALKA